MAEKKIRADYKGIIQMAYTVENIHQAIDRWVKDLKVGESQTKKVFVRASRAFRVTAVEGQGERADEIRSVLASLPAPGGSTVTSGR